MKISRGSGLLLPVGSCFCALAKPLYARLPGATQRQFPGPGHLLLLLKQVTLPSDSGPLHMLFLLPATLSTRFISLYLEVQLILTHRFLSKAS